MMSIYFMAAAAAQSCVVTCVMDYTDFGDLVGIAVVSMARPCRSTPDGRTTMRSMPCTFARPMGADRTSSEQLRRLT
jgi:hypothetical protein